MTRTTLLSHVAARLQRAGLLAEAPEHEALLTGIADDSRKVGPGDLFCAWHGTTSDAHHFAAAAADAGAVALLVERAVEGTDVPQLVVADGRRAASIAANLIFGEPAERLRLVGVTGTNGKTTTVGLLRHLLGLLGPTASIGTLGAVLEDGTVLPGSEALTTPGPVDLARTLADLVERGIAAAAMEVSSHALHQGRVAGVRFDIAVFTNLSRDHLDYHGTVEEYLAAKASLVELLRPDGAAVVNAEDPAWRGVAERAPRVLRFRIGGSGPAGPEDVRAEDLELGPEGARFTLRTGGGAIPVELPLLGAYNVQNALGAASAALALGETLEDVAARLRDAPQVPGRLERIAERPCTVLTDYAHTPDALERVLQTLRPLTPGRLIVVFGAGGDRDRGKRPEMGRVAAREADVAIVTSDNPRTEDPESILDDIVAGMDGAEPIRIVDRRAAIGRALEMARPEDVVLLAGKGHETYQVIGTEKVEFDERSIVHEWQTTHSRGE